MKANRREMRLRILAGSFGLAWFLAWPLMMLGSKWPAFGVLAALAWLAAYVGGPIVAVLLSKELAEGNSYLWGVGSFFVPGIVLPILAFWHLRRSLHPDTVRFPAGASEAAILRPALGAGLASLAPNETPILDRPLGGPPSAQAIAPLLGTLGAAEPFARAEAARALGQTGDLAAGGPLAVAARDRDPFVRRAAVQALGRLGGDATLGPLVQRLQDPAPSVRRQAALALGRIGATTQDQALRGSAAAALIGQFQDPDPSVRKYAAEMAGILGDPRAGAPLVALLGDVDAGLRAGAALALGWLGDGRAGKALNRSLQDPDAGVRQYAAWALARLTPQTEATVEEWPAFSKAVAKPLAGPMPIEADMVPTFGKEPPKGEPPAEVLTASPPRKGPLETATEAPPEVSAPTWQPTQATQGMVPLPAQARPSGAFAPETHTLAVVSLVTGIGTWFILPLVGAIAAIITGHLAKQEMHQQPERWRGRGLATAGLILGYVQIALIAGVAVVITITALLQPRMSTIVKDTAPTPEIEFRVVTATPDAALWATEQASQAQATEQARAVEATVQAIMVETTAQAQTQATPQMGPVDRPAWWDDVSAAVQWPVVAQDSFDSNLYVWPTGSMSDDFVVITQTIAGSTYQWEVLAKQGVNRRAWSSIKAVSDFVLGIDVTQGGGRGVQAAGVQFRINPIGDAYYFFVSPNQMCGLAVVENGVWQTIFGPVSNPAIQPSGMNRITIVAMGSDFVFFVNDRYVGEAQDSRLTSGTIALSVDVSAGDADTFEFDNLVLQAP